MFKFIKEKLKSIFSKTTEQVEEKLEQEKEKTETKVEEIKEEVKKIEEKINETKKEEAEKTENQEKKEEKIQELEEKLEKKKEEEKSLFSKIKEKFTTTQLSEEDFETFFKQLELAMLQSSIAFSVIDKVKEQLKQELLGKKFKKNEIEREIKDSFKNAISSLLLEPFDLIERIKEKIKEKPVVIVFFGINGSGKTTTIAKLTHALQKQGLSTVLAAADTFRAASIEQLEKHAAKLNVKVIKHHYGADPAAVAFDAIAHAKARGIDTVLIDTAGRMHTKANLLNEMQKICRVAKPHLKIFVGEAITGNDAVEQAKSFNESIGIDASILSKADVDEKAGAIISISYVTKKPILYLGTGQGYDDLKLFSKQEFITSLGL